MADEARAVKSAGREDQRVYTGLEHSAHKICCRDTQAMHLIRREHSIP